MDMRQSTPKGRDENRSDHSRTFGPDNASNNELNFPDDLLTNLKKNYEERIQDLENHIRETYHLIENDEIIRTMQMNQVSDDFRQQRIHEIVEDSLLAEKEMQIEKLNHANAILKTELARIDEENQKIIHMYNQEVSRFNKTISEFKTALQLELQAKNQLQQECDKLSNTLSHIVRQHEEMVKQKDGSEGHWRNEVNRLKQETENFRRQREDMEKTSKRKDEIIEEMRKDIETLKDEYIVLEKINGNLNAEHNSFGNVVAGFKEKIIQDESEINRLKESLEKYEEENKELKQELDRTLKENTDLIAKSEYISSQVKKLVENGQKNTNEIIEEVKQKHKIRLEEQKRKLEEANLANEDLKNEILALRNEVDENKVNYDNLVSQFQNDLKLVKNEWEKKCQEIDLRAQKEIAELQSKHQENIGKLQTEYQNLLHRKLKEAQEEAKEEIARIRVIEKETRAQLESKVSKFEKDYILKATHESSLAAEILDLKTKQMQELKDLEDKFERDYANKLRDVSEKNRQEYESSIISLRNQNKSLEQQIQSQKVESQKTLETAIKEKDRAQKLQIELEEVTALQKGLTEEIEDAKQNLIRIKGLYDEEIRKGKKKELEIEDLTKKIETSRRKETELNASVSAFKNEIAELKETMALQSQKLSKVTNQSKSSIEEIEILKITLEATEKEKKDLLVKVAEIECDLATSIEGEKEKQEALVKFERQMLESTKKQEALVQAEMKAKANLKELEEQLSKSRANERNLEDEAIRWRDVCKELQKKVETGDKEQKKKFAEALRLICREVGGLKQQVVRIKSWCKTEIEQAKNRALDLVKVFEKDIKEKMRGFSANEREAEEFEREREDYQRRLEKYERETRELVKDMQRVQRELQDAQAKAEDANLIVVDYERKIRKLEDEGARMREESARKVEEFQKLQGFVENELKRLKEESENVAKQMVGKYRQEITKMMGTIENLKNRRVERMLRVEEEVEKMQRENEKGMEEMKAWYEKKIRDNEKNTLEAENEIKELKRELSKSEELNEELKEENKKMMDSLEEKLRTVRDLVKRDKEKHSSEKLQESLENERLRQQLRELKVEFSIKEDKIKELTKLVMSYGGDKSKGVTYDKEWEIIGVKKQREKEMEELQNLLAKTMQDVGRKSFKMEAKPERDQDNTARRSTVGTKDYRKAFEDLDDTNH